MAFLFKSKKGQDRALASRDGHSGSQSSIQSGGVRAGSLDKNPSQARATPTGSMTSTENDGTNGGSPEQGHQRGTSTDQSQPQSDLQLRNVQQTGSSNASLYPWSQRRLTYTSSHASPFPRYGAAVNSVSSKEGDVYMMGGLINSSTVKGDLWMIEAGGNMACYPIATTAEGPGPRVGHSSLLVGNAFIVYGGDTKIDESDVLDETLYLLNTSTRQWSRALPAGPRPSGRYGHTLNILGSKIFIFGGQVEGYFMNDLSAFDLNQLQMANNRWEILLSGEASSKVPAPRTNHSMITHNDKMYLFGGTNGFQWFNDVWCYDLSVNKWEQLDCIGYIPASREGHAAALVDDVMYVFGGRTEEGTDLGDLAAFKIATRRWYTFQNMGPSPSSRSGHSMTTVGKSIVVLGGEPSSASSSTSDLGILYVLDTTKIRYPTDAQQAPQKSVTGRRSSLEGANGTRQMPARDGSSGPTDTRKAGGPPPSMSNAINGYRQPQPQPSVDSNMASNTGTVPASGSRLPRAAPTQSPAGPPPQAPAPAKPTAEPLSMGRVRGASADHMARSASPQAAVMHQNSPKDIIPEHDQVQVNGHRTPTQSLSRSGSKQESAALAGKIPRQARSQGSVDSTADSVTKISGHPGSPPSIRQTSNPLSRRPSQRNSQTVVLLKELDSARNRNAWYASELELARKSGYVSNATFSPALDAKAAETFDEEDRPLIEALIAMRTELANVQGAVDRQAVMAARQIAEAEKQRDAAISEAVYAKAKLAAQLSGAGISYREGGVNESGERSTEMGKKLSSALLLQKDLQSRIEILRLEVEAEKKARQLADDTTNAAQKRMVDLESYKQQTSAEVERLKSELHIVNRESREHSVASAEAVSAFELLKGEHANILSQYEEVVGSSKDHNSTFESLRSAIVASQDARSHLETKLEEERLHREKVENKHNKLKVEHETRTAELVAATQRLRDAEELSDKHATEARAHRQVVLAGLDKISTKGPSQPADTDPEALNALQGQITSANALVKKYQQEMDIAADKLRSAEERIAGLEQYQEQSSREGVAIRRQLQSAMRETQSLQAAHADARSQLSAQQLETNAVTVQHNALKDILAERGISPTAAVRSRNLVSPRTSSPEMSRLRDLEIQLANATASHEESKQYFANQAQESESAYRDKLSQLESDYQSAVHYVKGTEKMLKQLKDQLARYKQENSRLKTELVEVEDKLQVEGQTSTDAASWESERSQLRQHISSLQAELRTSGSELERNLEALQVEMKESRNQRDVALRSHEDVSSRLELHLRDMEQLQSENSLLEQRAVDAEQKVSLLLDQVEHSVDTYRRQSRQLPGSIPEHSIVLNGSGMGHTRNESSEAGSVYGGNGGDARGSAALDNLASELETLRSHWEATNKNYRLSTNFEFDSPAKTKRDDEASAGLSESLADWRKKLDHEEQADTEKTKLG